MYDYFNPSSKKNKCRPSELEVKDCKFDQRCLYENMPYENDIL
jgi:hypothetical protein